MGKRSRKQAVSHVAGEAVNRWDLKIAVCVPSGGDWRADTAKSVADMLVCWIASTYEGGEHDAQVFSARGAILPDNRHRLVAQAHRWGASHLLFIDSDMTFPADTIQKLIRHNKPVIAANCVRRKFPTYPTSWSLDDSYVYSRPDARGLEEVSHTGCAVMLLDMRVFDHPDLELPWFAFEPDPDKIPGVIGEDVYFCRKLRAAGIPVYIDHDLSREVGHIGDLTYTTAMADQSEAHYKTREARARVKAEQNKAGLETSKLDLTKITTRYINLKSDWERRKHMESMCRQLGLNARCFNAVRGFPGWRGAGDSLYAVLEEAIREDDFPLLVFEDDAEMLHWHAEPEIPVNADAVYLGTSQSSGDYNTWECGDWLRIENVRGAHAVLYMNADYARAVIEACKRRQEKEDRPLDVTMAHEVQIHKIVYGAREPWFSQADRFRKPDAPANEWCTSTPLRITDNAA